VSGRPIGEQEQAPAACLPYDPRAQDVAREVAGMINDRLPDITVEHVGSTTVSLGRYQLDAASFNMLTPSTTHSGEACHGDLPEAPSEYTLELAMGAG
jgi:hypothetical protein